jgi:hypothetical protein
MPTSVVEIPGVGNVEFPDSMSDAEVSQAAHRLYTNAGAQAISQNPPGVQPPQVQMRGSNLATAVGSTPSNADPQNPGNIPPELMAQMSPDVRARTQAQQLGMSGLTTLGGLLGGTASGTALASAALANPTVRRLGRKAIEGAAEGAGATAAYRYLKDLL